ncbi:30S ribosomal protein S6 [Patescibacteria group bacterium]|nr:MAG: 30S ribosomal protein S6 [Patescibacteria group bacterium]
MQYEICYLVGEAKDAELDRIKGEVEQLITGKGGAFVGIETVEKRKLAYPVNKEIRGTYVARRFEFAPSESEEAVESNRISEINKQLTLSADVMRAIVVNAAGLPELKQPEVRSSLLRRDDSRRGGGDRRRPMRPTTGYSRPQASAAPVSAPSAPVEKPVEKAAEPDQNIDQKLDEILNI